MKLALQFIICYSLARAIILPDVLSWHLRNCLLTISSRYISTSRTLVISTDGRTGVSVWTNSKNFTTSDSGHLDIYRSIYEELHKSESWNLVISNIFTSPPATDWHPYHKHGSYILLIPCTNDQEKRIVKSVKQQLKRLSYDPG